MTSFGTAVTRVAVSSAGTVCSGSTVYITFINAPGDVPPITFPSFTVTLTGPVEVTKGRCVLVFVCVCVCLFALAIMCV